jgi:oligopeptide/dipeptide ABC transporter ATP-binding protein
MLRAVDGISFDIHVGEIFGLVGESGCGKSVTSQSILRLYDGNKVVIHQGKVLFKGTNLFDLSARNMRSIRGGSIAMVFQDALSSLNPVMTVGKQITESLRIHQGLKGKRARGEAIEMLALVGIPAPEMRFKSFPHELSGGMRQRVMIAVALACRPQLLIADEPTTALDVTIQAQVMDLLVELKKKLGMGIILITHDLGVVAETCDRVAVMYLGQIVESGTTGDVFRDSRHPYTEGLMLSIPQVGRGAPRRLYMIPGTVPMLDKIPEGCRFAPRCRYASEICRKSAPELMEVEPGHTARCWKTTQMGAAIRGASI